MAKKPLHKNHSFLTILCILLVVIIGYMGLKFIWAKMMWYNYGVQMQNKPMQFAGADSAEDAGMINATIIAIPANKPLLKQPKALQEYITLLSQKTNRDIVVMDKNKMILADTVPANVGKVFMEDTGNQAGKSIADGQMYTFTEKSIDYPQGIYQTVIPLKNAQDQIIGAIIMSSSTVFK